MAEALKHMYNVAFIDELCGVFQAKYPAFDDAAFVQLVFDQDWHKQALKQRMHHISRALFVCLPDDYVSSLAIIKEVAPSFDGFTAMIFPDFIEQYGLANDDISLDALEYLTSFSSAEFAVRPFIMQTPEKTMQRMTHWATSPDAHVRRLASEGCRPRLPWAMQLPLLIENPADVLRILEILKTDISLYVRKSVANNLNDISKDHPQMVITLAHDWLGKDKHTDWIVKHGCRSLLKQGNVEVLALFGYTVAAHITVDDFQVSQQVLWGGVLKFSCQLTSQQKLGLLRLEFAMTFQKSKGKTSRKVFKISEADVQTKAKKIEKSFPFKAISTRKYYAGKHQLELIINGKTCAKQDFILLPHQA